MKSLARFGTGLSRAATCSLARATTVRALATTATSVHTSSPSAEPVVTPPEGSTISLKSASRDESKFGTRPIYLDVQATSPTDPRVVDKMLEFYTGMYGNPHSSTHAYGWETDKEVEKAREYIAAGIKADPKEIIFTSGATESNNMAIKGVPRFYKKTKKHIITTQTEHKCVLDSARHMQDEGFDVTYLPVNEQGLISLDDLKNAIRKDTILVSVMAVNNEIGVIQPLKEIGQICRDNKIFFHTDAAQAYGKIDIDVNAMNIDLLSISSHKIYGPMGIGAIYIRRRPRVRLDPIITGGGQERGLRSGTLAPPLVAGFGEAARLMQTELEFDKAHITKLSEKLRAGLLSIPSTQLNGSHDPNSQYPGCVNISFAYIEGESLLMALKDIALSSGSACTSASLEPSYVLHALGADDALAHSSIRFGIGRFTTEAEIDYVINAINERVDFLRKMSPLWEMVQEGIDLDSIEWSGH
ncbi:mitochondrial cysteine desulfurase [Suhomyces tanzawaensis NRRL Y-17324]|uniref:Cysteine desulfurase, mitochondrial n=1 Tax=Suhomyces tanzawaensis NRRL Y-17324 TaxID=984487 RepID=A0A1E4SRB1_9ASCO|nr:mitochondrial cysteine desulfurase [Suhomyces tanzawaensis NRRL Y-17324]ODV82049.1 mitochondrial cysteine desulfurase [Suhomyces tanzawaensis NRRL Y-17324]